MYFGDCVVIFVTWLPLCQPKPNHYLILNFIATYLHMNSSIGMLCLLHLFSPHQRSSHRCMLLSVDTRVDNVVDGKLIHVEIIISKMGSLLEVDSGSSPDSGKAIQTDSHHKINGLVNR
jgi:hypothetical protein